MKKSSIKKPKKKFFLSAGIWKDTNITAKSLREEAWKRK